MGTSALARAFYQKGKVVLVEPLSATLRPGSVGYFSDGQWVEVSTTRRMFGLTLSLSGGSDQPNSFDGKGGKGFSFQVKAAGVVSDLVPKRVDAKLRAEVFFGSHDGFVMSVRNQSVKTAQDLAELMAAIRWAYHFRSRLSEGKRWMKKYAVIVGIATAESVTAVSAASSNAAIVIEGSAKVPTPTTPAELDAKMKITRTRESTDTLWRGPASGYAVMALRLDPSVWKRWQNEEFKYGAKAPTARTPSPEGGQILKRPVSFVAWAEDEGLSDPANTDVNLITATGRATTRGTANTVMRSATKAAAKTEGGKAVTPAPAEQTPNRR
ncbi:MAG: hypothetical protein ACRDNT_30550 [Streptosporangiaceae bacterium]